MTEQEKKQKVSEYNRRYYNEKRKKKLQEQRQLAEEKLNGIQLELFKEQSPDTILPNETEKSDQEKTTFKGVQLTMFDIETELENSISRPLDLEKSQSNLSDNRLKISDYSGDKKKISILRGASYSEKTEEKTLEKLNSRKIDIKNSNLEISRIPENFAPPYFSRVETFQDQDLVSSFVELVKTQAKDRLFPNVESKKKNLGSVRNSY